MTQARSILGPEIWGQLQLIYLLVIVVAYARADTGAQAYFNNSLRVHSLPVSTENLPTAIPTPFVSASRVSMTNGDLRLDISGGKGRSNDTFMNFTKISTGQHLLTVNASWGETVEGDPLGTRPLNLTFSLLDGERLYGMGQHQLTNANFTRGVLDNRASGTLHAKCDKPAQTGPFSGGCRKAYSGYHSLHSENKEITVPVVHSSAGKINPNCIR